VGINYLDFIHQGLNRSGKGDRFQSYLHWNDAYQSYTRPGMIWLK